MRVVGCKCGTCCKFKRKCNELDKLLGDPFCYSIDAWFFPSVCYQPFASFLGTCLCMVVRRPDCYSYSFETLKLFAEVAVSSELSIYLAKKLVQFINLEALPWYSFQRSDSQCPPQDHEVHHGVMFLDLFTPEYRQKNFIKIQKNSFNLMIS